MNVAFIPVRGGSKSIPLKNIKILAGKPLVYWTIKAAVECSEIALIYVATDNQKIRSTIENFKFNKVKVIERSEATATDTASTESAMIEFAEKYEFEKICLIQATSPLLTAEDLTRGFNAVKEADSVLSVVRQKRFLWKQNEFAEPLNYNYNNRPRRQEFDGFLVENGAFYITSRVDLLKSRCRISGRIKVVEMSEDTYFEIDEPSDWIITEHLLKARKKYSDKKIKMFLTDCDGTLTDGGMYYTVNGDTMKKFCTSDGVGLNLLKSYGIITGIITGENSEIVQKRGEKLKLDEIMIGIQNKLEVVTKLCQKYNVSLNEVAYIGDDLNDVELLKSVGLSICPANAVDEVKNIADYVTKNSGGNGAVRESAEYILEGEKFD